jgi:hypothetical protein
VYARSRQGNRCARGSACAMGSSEHTSLQACRAYCKRQRKMRSDMKHVLIPLPILEFIENSGKVEILFEMLNRLLSLDISRSPGLAGMDVIPSD